jgi:phage-related protein
MISKQGQKSDKRIDWFAEVKTPPISLAVRRKIGFHLRDLQEGKMLPMPHSRPMPSIGIRVHELRVQDSGQTWRLIYRIDEQAIVVLEVFLKTTQQTPKQIIDLARKN